MTTTTTTPPEFPASTIGGNQHKGVIVYQTIPVGARGLAEDVQGDSDPGQAQRHTGDATDVLWPGSMTGDAFRADQATAHGRPREQIPPVVDVQGAPVVDPTDHVDMASNGAQPAIDGPIRPLPMEPPIPGRCGALRTTENKYCTNYPRRWQKRCGFHGGASGQALSAAKRREVEAQASVSLLKSGYSPLGADTSPVEALMDVAGQCLALRTILADRVSELQSLTVTDRSGAELARGILQAFERSLDRCSNVLIQINRLGLEERKFRADQATGKRLADAINASVWDETADVTTDQGHAIQRRFRVEWEKLEGAS
jgi:hypothetical protein